MNLSQKNIGIISNNIEEFSLVQQILFRKGYKWIYFQKNLKLDTTMLPLIIFLNLPRKRNNMMVETYKQFKEDNPTDVSHILPIYEAKSLIRKSKLENIANTENMDFEEFQFEFPNKF